ncbi:MAG: NAD(P)/FAD-dependent oxidoreductase [Hyphomonadaceae bacterium]|nr:NAD(P)/FAD-dependent oxidoreductase [Hyphomonadaceae bacterium]MBC6412178.1 NAD(P)/FAD-dependent oxidoreductase [Hyphomonadaceae bacterium]
MGVTNTDVLIIGAGISGLSAAAHLIRMCPGKSFQILEARDTIGGTWDLFRYPGIRSDSDMQTFGFKFKPWKNPQSVADASSIMEYLHETVEEYSLGNKIRFGHKCIGADWSSGTATWTVKAATDEGLKTIACNFLHMCAGYYSYDDPHNPDIPGEADFNGPVIHPQFWDENLNYRNRRVVVIGSGATAVTIIPALAEDTAYITMLQRSPTYIASRPAKDWFADACRAVLPEKWAYRLAREKNIQHADFVYKSSLKNPAGTKKKLFKMVRKSLDLPKNAALPHHYIPHYNPWEQRLCAARDNDFFEVIKSGKADIVTDHIETITKTGIRLKCGKHLECDIIIKATGINVVAVSEGEFTVDGDPVDFSGTFTYEGLMFSDIPNMALTYGYVNASWTLRADLVSGYVCRLLKHMDGMGVRIAVPRAPEGMEAKPWITTFTPNYITRIIDTLPWQGDREPWINTQDYKRDRKVLPTKPIDDGHVEFSSPPGMAEVAQ